jgi:hypothetical protein
MVILRLISPADHSRHEGGLVPGLDGLDGLGGFGGVGGHVCQRS